MFWFVKKTYVIMMPEEPDLIRVKQMENMVPCDIVGLESGPPHAIEMISGYLRKLGSSILQTYASCRPCQRHL